MLLKIIKWLTQYLLGKIVSKIELLPEEQIVISSGNDELVLTNKRLRYDSKEFGKSNFLSMTLSSVASCGLVTKSQPILLLISIILAALAISIGDGEATATGLAISVLFTLIYFGTRKAVLSIASTGGREIMVSVQGMKREELIRFVNTVENLKLNL